MTAVTSFDAAPADRRPRANGVLFNGAEDTFWRLLTRGAVLLFLTLGIYRFWLQTDVRRFLWNNTEIAGDNLECIGTARELLLGFLVAIAFLVPIYAIFGLASLAAEWIGQLAGLLSLAALAVLGQFAVYRARRYRLSRTVYRGIRFHQTGSAWRYAICAIFWWGMIGMKLGVAHPGAPGGTGGRRKASSASRCAIPGMAICAANSPAPVHGCSSAAFCSGLSWSARF